MLDNTQLHTTYAINIFPQTWQLNKFSIISNIENVSIQVRRGLCIGYRNNNDCFLPNFKYLNRVQL